ncbi:MAG: hypothetical protein CL993_03030 [Euryarchaeota archaeon]|nr:hypothetical protein [Euryarchaeota archaeon]|tara:strand:- start:21690 stop:23828 length:2139 start_codon:yes stop_codon:yes gene_type:complete
MPSDDTNTGIAEILDVNEDGEVNLEDLKKLASNIEQDSIDSELSRIRERRTNPDKRFLVNTILPRTIDDYTLVFGLTAGVVFFGTILIASSGILMGDSINIDKATSGTILDPNECVDKSEQIWFQNWIDEDYNLHVSSQNAPENSSILMVKFSNETELIEIISGKGDLSLSIDDEILGQGEYDVSIELHVWSDDNSDYSNLTFNESLSKLNSDPATIFHSKSIIINVELKEKSSLWGAKETYKTMEKIDEESRACWTFQQLGAWGWVLMGAEWVGGRETAMLTGGSAQVPPWFMALVSMGMSVFFLCVQYPLMHRLYHRETDDVLTSEQMHRLIHKTIIKASQRLQIRPDYDTMKVQDRAISIDVFLPYQITRRTIATPVDVKARIIKEILSEFAIFGEMRPLQLKTNRIDKEHNKNRDRTEFIEPTSLDQIDYTKLKILEDYQDFFSSMSNFGKLEVAFGESMRRWFKKHDVADYGSAIMADEESVFVRVIYRPVSRFAYFLFKPTYKNLQGDLREQLKSELSEYIGKRTLVVSARNERSTLADRAVAGRVEQGSEELSGEAMVAKRGGISGALLQNPFMGDILSTVEFVAQKNRSRIDKYGFWGLIVFVWIPFMASGVLVGAMLGLVSRMKFERVLIACLIGGSIASITWAYTARGIIEFMERYHAEAFFPFLILLVIAFTWIHIRNNRQRRREELFRDSMAFFSGASEA